MALDTAWGSGVPWLSARTVGGKAHKLSLLCLCCCSPQANQLPPLLVVFSQTIGKPNYIPKDIPTTDSVQLNLMKNSERKMNVDGGFENSA